VAGPALAARIRLEEKLRGAALPPASPSRSVALPLPPSLHSASFPVFHMHAKTSDLFKTQKTGNMSDYRKMKRLDKSSRRYTIALSIPCLTSQKSAKPGRVSSCLAEEALS
jgi:hypothetical protein